MRQSYIDDIDVLHKIADRTSWLRLPLNVKGSDGSCATELLRVFKSLDTSFEEEEANKIFWLLLTLAPSLVCAFLTILCIHYQQEANKLSKKYDALLEYYSNEKITYFYRSDSLEIQWWLAQLGNIPNNLLDTLSSYNNASVDTTFRQLLTTQWYDLSKDSISRKVRVMSSSGWNFHQETIWVPIAPFLPLLDKKIVNIDYENVSYQTQTNQYLAIFTEDYYFSVEALKVLNSVVLKPWKSYNFWQRIKRIVNFIWSHSLVEKWVEQLWEKVSLRWLTLKSDYNVPWALVPFLWWNCNSNVWLFVQLCRLNNIPSAIWVTKWHCYAYIGVKDGDIETIKRTIPDVSLFDRVKVKKYWWITYIPVEPSSWWSWTDWELNASWENDWFAIFWPK